MHQAKIEVRIDLEDFVEANHGKHIVNTRAQPGQIDVAALPARAAPGCDEAAEATTVDVGDVAEIDDDPMVIRIEDEEA